jgi:hypothetical protein
VRRSVINRGNSMSEPRRRPDIRGCPFPTELCAMSRQADAGLSARGPPPELRRCAARLGDRIGAGARRARPPANSRKVMRPCAQSAPARSRGAAAEAARCVPGLGQAVTATAVSSRCGEAQRPAGQGPREYSRDTRAPRGARVMLPASS